MLKTYELLEQPPIAFRRYFVTVQREYPNLVETLQSGSKLAMDGTRIFTKSRR